MQWRGRRQSGNIEDRRGIGGRGLAIGGGGIITVIVVLLVLLLGGDPGAVIDQNPLSPGPASTAASTGNAQQDQLTEFVSVVLADYRRRMDGAVPADGRDLQVAAPRPLLGDHFDPCGLCHAASGPFYSPQDEKVYLDLSFLSGADRSLPGPGRLRGRVRDRARGGTSRPEALGDNGAGRGGPKRSERG